MSKPKTKSYLDSDDEGDGQIPKSMKIMSQSAGLSRKGGNDTFFKKEKNNVDRQMTNIEHRMDRASQNRDVFHHQKMAHHQSKPELDILLQNKFEREQKFMEDTFSKVTIKRVEKDKHLRKMEKDMRENMETRIEDQRLKDDHKQETF